MYAAVADFWLDGDWDGSPPVVTLPTMSLLGVGS